jgi:two-component system chemotaxis response regulator CheB
VIKVLVTDDSALMRKLLGEIFGREPDFTVEYARNGVEALERIKTFEPNVITLDIQMPEMDGLRCLERIMIEHPCPVVMVSSATAADADATFEAIRIGAVDFVGKPAGALSLSIPDMGAQLVSKVRAAAEVKLRPSSLLRQRVRHKLGRAPVRPAADRKPHREAQRLVSPNSGEGIVLVGASTGGPPALEAVLAPLPSTFPWPIVIAQHIPASFTGPLARRLDRLCALTVMEVTKPVKLEPGHAYLGRGDSDVIISVRSGRPVAMSAPADGGYPWHPSTTRLVNSAMKHIAGNQLIGILLTGMGNDGADAMTSLHATGGCTIAESEETAVVWGMPGELVKANGADWVVALPEIASLLQQLLPTNAIR